MRFVWLIFFCLIMLQSFGQKNEFGWLMGTWKITDKNVYEVWKLAEDKISLEGISYTVKGADTIVTERVKLRSEQNTFYYIPDVAGAQLPVYFKISQYTTHSFSAENPEHDFPKIIRYKFVRNKGKDWLEAAIEGDGKIVPYSFEKIR